MVLIYSLFSPWLLIVATVGLTVLVSAADSALKINDLFDISFDSNVGGNCAGYSEAVFNGLLADALNLAKAGESAANDMLTGSSETSDEADRLLSAFFLEPSSDDVGKIRKRYSAVSRWLRKGGNVVLDKIDAKPYLFCGDSWAIRQEMSDQMVDIKGVPLKKNDGTPYLISDDSPSRKKRRGVASAENVKPGQVYPYYSERAGIYTFGLKYSDDPTVGFCQSAKIFGFTEFSVEAGASFIVLCPTAFTNVALRSVQAAPNPSTMFSHGVDTFPKTVQKIDAVKPGATTLFHELFHLLQGDKMSPADGEEYNTLRMMGAKTRKNGNMYTQKSALQNPQSYVYAAIAYDYTQHSTVTYKNQDLPVEFYTGYCTYEV